jgi:hypothetical protein
MRLGLITCLFLSGFGTSGAADERPKVTLYTTAGCRPCQLALQSLLELGIEPTIQRDCPSWVTQTPVIHWRDSAGVWRQHAPRHWSGPTWTDAETAKLRRWLLIDSATKSTARDPYLMVTALADTRETAAPGPKVSNQLAGMRPVTLEHTIAFNVNNLRNLLRIVPADDMRRGFVITALASLETIYDPAESYIPPPRQESI